MSCIFIYFFKFNRSFYCLWVLFFFFNIQGYITAGFPKAALSVHDEMLQQGLKPDRLAYNTLIFACVKSENLDAAKHYFEEMKVSSLYCMTSLERKH